MFTFGWFAVARGDDGMESGHSAGTHEHEASAIVAGRAVAAVVCEPEPLRGGSSGGPTPEVLGGGGIAVERPLPHHLAVEFAVSGTTGRETREVPLELIVERTWSSAVIEPYVGIGPAVVVRTALAEQHTDVRVGGTAIVGTHLWASRHWGVLFEVDGVVTGPGPATVTSELLTGVVARWE